jgi:hypothetical protein
MMVIVMMMMQKKKKCCDICVDGTRTRQKTKTTNRDKWNSNHDEMTKKLLMELNGTERNGKGGQRQTYQGGQNDEDEDEEDEEDDDEKSN